MSSLARSAASAEEGFVQTQVNELGSVRGERRISAIGSMEGVEMDSLENINLTVLGANGR